MESKEVKESGRNIDEAQLDGNICFNYFGYAMQFDFFNSLVQPLSLDSYIKRFSVIEDTTICRSLILGALDTIPKYCPDLNDTDD